MLLQQFAQESDAACSWQEAGDSPRAVCVKNLKFSWHSGRGVNCKAGFDGGPNRCHAPGAAPGRMLANRLPKSVPGTRRGARSDASKQTAQIGARHPV